MLKKIDLGPTPPTSLPKRFKILFSLAHRKLHTALIGLLAAWVLLHFSASVARAESLSNETLLLESVNTLRHQQNAPALFRNHQLDRAALAQAQHLARLGQLSHLGAKNEHLGIRLKTMGYAFAESAENLAAGPIAPARVRELWQESPGHNLNMLHPSYSEAGIGIAAAVDETIYWVLILARPLDP